MKTTICDVCRRAEGTGLPTFWQFRRWTLFWRVADPKRLDICDTCLNTHFRFLENPVRARKGVRTVRGEESSG